MSVIVPNYNYECYLEQRIESVLMQSYHDFEVIILDDCSTDGSRSVIERYRSNDKISHIVYNEKNSGSTFLQWDKGFELAKGDLIWIAESDDYADCRFLERLIVAFDDKDVVLSFSNSYQVKDDRLELVDKIGSGFVVDGEAFIKSKMLMGNAVYNASAALFRKSCLSEISHDYKDYKAVGDKLFWIEVARKGKVCYCAEALNYFRIHSGKVTSKAISSGLLYKEEFEIFKQLERAGYVSFFKKRVVPGFYLSKIEDHKGCFQANSIYEEVVSLWETPSSNSRMFYKYYAKWKNWQRRIKNRLNAFV